MRDVVRSAIKDIEENTCVKFRKRTMTSPWMPYALFALGETDRERDCHYETMYTGFFFF